MKFNKFFPAACGFPAPKVPALPSFPSGLLGKRTEASYRSAFSATAAVSFASGRYALAYALAHAGVAPGKRVLVPAYHCRTMIDPVVRHGGEAVLYPLNQDMTPDEASLESLRQANEGVVAIIVTHYFGFPQPIELLRDWSDRHGISLIEDCSHAYVGSYHGTPLGRFGDWAIASPHKFYACEQLGILLQNRSAASSKTVPRSWKDEFRAAWHALVQWADQLRRGLHLPSADVLNYQVCGEDKLVSDPGISKYFDAGMERAGGLRWSRWVAKFSSVGAIAERRRANYQAWLAVVREMPACNPLFPDLPDGVVPYMFPVWIEDSGAFFALKRAGMPIFRWDELGESECPFSARARLSLLHLPCHQGIGPREMDWMSGLLRMVLIKG